jgi:hypothetical protein
MIAHLPFAIELPAAVIGMAVRDATGTLENIAANRGREKLAAWMDVGNDAGNLAWTAVGIDAVLTSPTSPQTAILLVAVGLTSYWGTRLWTRLGKRIQAD